MTAVCPRVDKIDEEYQWEGETLHRRAESIGCKRSSHADQATPIDLYLMWHVQPSYREMHVVSLFLVN